MSTKFLMAVPTLALALAAPCTQAFVDPPVLATPNPVAGQPVAIDIVAGVCDAFMNPPPPTVTENGSDIRIELPSVYSFDSEFCFYPTLTYHFVVGSFPEGNYSLQVDRTYMDAGGSQVTQTLGVLALVVSPAINAPALTWPGVDVLIAALMLVALPALQNRLTRML